MIQIACISFEVVRITFVYISLEVKSYIQWPILAV